MLVFQKYKNKKFAVYGMGLTGRSAAKTLIKSGAKVYCWDDDIKIRKEIKNSKFLFSKFWLNKNTLDNILISPGIDVNKCKIKKYLNKNLKKIITDLDLFFEISKNNLVISITGTNGKSTTCKLVEKILKAAKYNVKTAGNIGKPILTLKKTKKKYTYIVEASSYQLQYSKLFRSQHAAILNVSPDHLERHKNMKNYIQAKSRIFLAQNTSDYSYINLKNRYSKNIISIFKRKKIKSKLILINNIKYNFLKKKIDNKYFKSKGNFENLIFAYKIAKNLNISDKTIIKAINKFKGLPHRQEIVFSKKNILCINDSKATSFDASLQSLLNYDKIYWIVGGFPKHEDVFYLQKIKKKIIKAYIIGNSISFFKSKIKKHIPLKVSKNILTAVNSICKDIKKNKDIKKTILLSPAAASFDQFKNFEDRGNYFKSLVIKKFKKINV